LASGQPDAVLLERFLADQDENAFATLVERHGPMVLAVCRSRLHDHWDIEDAFQSTFLKLVRSAHSIRRAELLGHWLYRVAHHCALRTRQKSAKHRQRSDLAAEVATVEPDGELSVGEVRQAMFEEINRLVEKYRVPVVLCYLEGLSHEEAARRLGWPLGTVKGRLSRARERLRQRLVRRGLTLTAALLALLSLEDLAKADVPPELVDATVKSARKLTAKRPVPAPLAPTFAWMGRAALTVALVSLIGVSTFGVSRAVGGRAFGSAAVYTNQAAGGCHASEASSEVAVGSAVAFAQQSGVKREPASRADSTKDMPGRRDPSSQAASGR
jgi:RNA polymerase sigma factor (sigma-70 family)